MPPHDAVFGPAVLVGCVLAGMLGGVLAALLTQLVYAVEDAFAHLHDPLDVVAGHRRLGSRHRRLHLSAGLGVGYDKIGCSAARQCAAQTDPRRPVVKSLMWGFSLGSGTSGGVLAPLLMIGGALGGSDALFLPHQGPGFWPLLGMGAMLAGAMRSPLTGVIFAFELTGATTPSCRC